MNDDQELAMRLRQAVHSAPVPPELAAKIRQQIDATGSERPWLAGWWRLAAPGAVACLIVAIGIQVFWLRHRPEAVMSALLAKVTSGMRPGLDDHLHCSRYGNIPNDIPPFEEAVRYLPDRYAGMLRTVQDHSPEPFRLYSAHECTQGGRRFVHFQLKTDSKLLSVIVTRRGENEKFLRDRVIPALAASGGKVFAATADSYEIAAIETREYLAYVVSDLTAEQNSRIMLGMAPEIRAFLDGLRS